MAETGVHKLILDRSETDAAIAFAHASHHVKHVLVSLSRVVEVAVQVTINEGQFWHRPAWVKLGRGRERIDRKIKEYQVGTYDRCF